MISSQEVSTRTLSAAYLMTPCTCQVGDKNIELDRLDLHSASIDGQGDLFPEISKVPSHPLDFVKTA